MEPAHFIAFNIAIIGTLASPGPAFIALIRTSFAHGRGAGLRCGLGLALASVSWTVLALAGLSAIFTLVPWTFLALKMFGAAYLLWLAVALWRGASGTPDIAPRRGLSGFRLGLITNFANPKLVFLLAAIFTTILPAMPRGETAVILVLNHLLLELVWYGVAALILTTAPARSAYLRLKARIDRAAALILGAMALRIVS